jgi:hypothetical protein
MQMGQVRFNKSHAICLTSIVCKFVVEGEVFVRKKSLMMSLFLKKKKVTVRRVRMSLVLRKKKVTL